MIKVLKESKEKTFTYDNDATYFNSDKKSAAYSYQKEKQFSALLGIIPELSGLCVTMDYRPGNVSPAKGILKIVYDLSVTFLLKHLSQHQA